MELDLWTLLKDACIIGACIALIGLLFDLAIWLELRDRWKLREKFRKEAEEPDHE